MAMISKLIILRLLASHQLITTTTALITTATPSQFHTRTKTPLTPVRNSKCDQPNAAPPIEKRTTDDYCGSSSRSTIINDLHLTTTTTTTTTHSISSSPSSSSMSRSRFLQLASASIVTASTTASASPTTASAAVVSPQQSSSSSSSLPLLPTTTITTKTTSETIQESISGFVAGGALSATKTFVKYPLDTATIRLQMPSSPYSLTSPLALFSGSYRGILTPLLCNIPAGAIFFAVKDATKQAAKERGYSRLLSTCLSVAVAQFPYWLVRNPSEVVKTRQQAGVIMEEYRDLNTWEAFRMVYDEGRRRRQAASDGGGGAATALNPPPLEPFYDGYIENILYAYPADVIKFICYENLSKGRKNLPPLEGAVYGALATAVAQCVTTPLDVVRNRVMMTGVVTTAATTSDRKDNNNNSSSSSSSSSSGYWEKLTKIAKEEGVKGLFAGVTPRVGKAVLSGAIQFATYEETKIKIGQFFERSSSAK